MGPHKDLIASHRHDRAGALRVGESFRFRLVYDSTVAFTTYTVYPTITVAATPASVTVSLGSVAGTKGVGTVTARGNVTVTLGGVSQAATAGPVSATGTVWVNLTGVQDAAAARAVDVTTTSGVSVTANLTGVEDSATASAVSADGTAGAWVDLTGVESAAQSDALLVSFSVIADLTASGNVGEAGTVSVSVSASTSTSAFGALSGTSGITGQGKRIVWTTGTLTGDGVAVGIPDASRIYAPAWGNSSIAGNTQVAYVARASAYSPAIVTGLGGYVLVDSGERLAGASAAVSIEGANLKTGAVVCDGTSDLTGDAQSLLAGASEADGSCVAQADACVAFVADGIVLAGDRFDLDGNPQPSSTSAYAGATTHAQASASAGSRMEGSAPTSIPVTGTITGSSSILYVEVLIYDAEGLEGISTTDASASLDMRAHALSVNLSYPVAIANYDPVKMAGTFVGASIAMGLATVAWNERPPR